ncbi:hypothetical protein F0U59_38825 [Archangium gephyra]|nr:hypothetical protein F0U59_38825 [Archangium gephyra]
MAGGISGINGSLLTLVEVEVYDPETGLWSSTSAMSVARRSHTATRLLDGKVLVVGGNAPAARSSAELYDPEKGTWTLSGTLNVGRHSARATLLPTGQVLIAGGAIAAGTIANVELYEQETGGWASSALSMNHPRQSHALTLLPSGKVLITGGADFDVLHASAEIYEDTGALDAWRPTPDAAVLRPGAAAHLTGNGFRGVSEASSGNTQGSATHFPMLSLMAVEVGAVWRVPSANASDTSVTGALPQVPAGYYFLTVVTNAIPGGRVVRVQGTPFLPPTVGMPAPNAMVNTLLTSGTAEPGSTARPPTAAVAGTSLWKPRWPRGFTPSRPRQRIRPAIAAWSPLFAPSPWTPWRLALRWWWPPPLAPW